MLQRHFIFSEDLALRPGRPHSLFETQSEIPDDHLGILLLALGAGALVMMFFAGAVAARLGCRHSLTLGGLGMIVCLNGLCVICQFMPAL